jgi:hypothetical protein
MAQEYEHLPMVREAPMAPRRRVPNRGGARYPNRGNREEYAGRLREASNELLELRQRKASPPGIAPHLVFRVPLHSEASLRDVVAALEGYGLTVVGVESKQMVVAFHGDVELNDFRAALDRYEEGPQVKKSGERAKSTVADILQAIEPEGMALWGREDRVGAALAEGIGAAGERIETSSSYVVDVELWYPGALAASAAVDEVRTLVGAAGESDAVRDVYIAPGLVLLRLEITGTLVDALLELDAVASVDLPPRPEFDSAGPSLTPMSSFTAPTAPAADGPRVCVLDTGVAGGHPLLAANLGYAASFLEDDDSPADDHGHGTKVCGQAVFGDVRGRYENDDFSSPVILLSAKIIGRNGRFDDHKLTINQLEDAIRLFSAEPYNCRVFNLSVGVERALFRSGNRRQGLLAESVDRLARQYGVLMVVSAGNHDQALLIERASADSSESFPGLLFREEAGLCDPAASALSLTVGGLAEHDTTEDDGSGQIRVAVARCDEPAPMTRTGPGINGAIKPELADYAGNAVTVSHDGGLRLLASDRSVSVLCLSNNPSDSLFLYGNGTSLAAPRVARTAAILHRTLEKSFGGAVHPNLVRALLASSATPPDATANVCLAGDDILKAVGYGRPSEDAALNSAPTRVTLIAQDTVPVDHFHIYEIPATEAFKRARGTRSMTVALAFDPPVRRRRFDYLAVEMDFLVIRGRSIEEVFESCRHCRPDEDWDDTACSIQGAQRMVFRPAAFPRNSEIKRGRGTLQKAAFFWQRREAESRGYGDSYWLVVRAKEKWPSGADAQDYAVVVTMRADDEQLYAQVRARVRERARTRIR